MADTMNQAQRAAELAARAMYEADHASRWFGMQIVEIAPGRCRMSMTIRPEMVNGHRICHGGLIFSLADSAFAFACNSHGDNTVAASATIDFLAPGREGDVVTATAREQWRSGRSGIYEVVVVNQRGETLALFRGRSQRVAGRVVERPGASDGAS
jgi:acyl-CoA thioesterase